ncbi:MAG: FHA domain-containing protein [Xanthomonadales bacterium]|nr:FHA domain-containing protein [Xanthomonadales bacterium]
MNKYRLKGASGKVAGLSHDLGQRTRIGSDAACELRVDDPKLSAMQAEISLQADGSLRLVQLDNSGDVLLNGKAVSDALINSGDEIRLGTCRWVLQAPGLRPEKVLTQQAVKRGMNWMPWLMAAALSSAAALAWQRGWLPF